MKVLLASEGSNELDYDGDAGALAELVRPYLPIGTVIERIRIADPRLRRNVVKGKREGHYFKRLQRLLWLAEREEFDGVVAVVDEDGVRDRREGVSKANADQAFRIPRAFGVAIPTFDAWMLADESALSDVMNCKVQRQPDLETMKRTEPKSRVDGLNRLSDYSLTRTELYVQVAKKLDQKRLSQRCPLGFAMFRGLLLALQDQLCSQAD
ncbi:MAG: hypothetical protein ACK5Q5_09050 [Planctomycetaceae bacterium]